MAKAGRPSEYKEEYVDKADEYLATCIDDEGVTFKEEKITKDLNGESDKEISTRTTEKKLTVKLPTHEGFAKYLGVNTSSLYAWEKEHKTFSKALAKIKEEQKERLLNKGLSGEYHSTIAKLILASNHGMADKVDNDIKSDGKALAPTIINIVKPNDKEDKDN